MIPTEHNCAGLGLRIPHIKQVIDQQPDVPWFEVHIDNFLSSDLNRALLDNVAERYPLSFHSVNMNLGGASPLDTDYLKQLKKIIDDLQPALVSDHVCFTSLDGEYLHDLLPVPCNESTAKYIAERISRVQDFLDRKILVENISRYSNYPQSDLTEAEFLSIIVEESHCGLILDINNAYVNHINLGDSLKLLHSLPVDSIQEIHLAGHDKQGAQLIDTHGCAISDSVWQLFQEFYSNNPQIPFLIEWDNNLPAFDILLEQSHISNEIQQQIDRDKNIKIAENLYG